MRKRAVGWSMVVSVLMTAGCTGIVHDADGTEPRGPSDTRENPEIPQDPTRPQMIETCDDSYEPVAPISYAARIKNLLNGQPLTDEEFVGLAADPSALGDYIDAWFTDPQAAPKLHSFFRTTFQQEQFEHNDLTGQWGDRTRLGIIAGTDGPPYTRANAALASNFADSFAHTAVDLVERRRPFSEVATTEQFMMTTAMLVAMAYLDERVIDDAEEVRAGQILVVVR